MFYLWVMLVLVLLMTIGMYFLPAEVAGIPLKSSDILSELRVETPQDGDMLVADGEGDIEEDEAPKRVEDASARIKADSIRNVRKRDSIYSILVAERAKVDTAVVAENVLFEDFSPGHTGLKSIFEALRRRGQMDKPIYIAALGDSFIEGDIFTLDVRRLLQQRYGGGGVGWMPMYSQVSGYRQGVKQRSKGWKETTILNKSKSPLPLSGRLFRAQGQASVEYTLDESPVAGNSVTRLYYAAKDELNVRYTAGDSTMNITLPAADPIGEYTFPISSDKVGFSVQSDAEAATFFGMSLETDQGVVLDNYSLRGNSGIPLGSLDADMGSSLNADRPYHLIILQYGLNVASAKQKNYRSYGNTMIKVVRRLQELFPQASILIMGISDRGVRVSGQFVTMPSIPDFIAEQRRVAQETGVVFWDTYAAMQSLGGINGFVSKGWAAKDYTHMSFKGGRRLAEEMLKAFDFEDKYYEALL